MHISMTCHSSDSLLSVLFQFYAFVEEKQKVHCLNTLFSKVSWCVKTLFRPG